MDLNTVITLSLFAFGLMAVVAVLASVLIRGIVVVLASAQKVRAAKAPSVVSVAVTPARDEAAEHAAAIAAAVFAVLGAHRMVYIGPAQPGVGWTSEIRTRLHTSHAPRGDRR
jgi:hypothetical protein